MSSQDLESSFSNQDKDQDWPAKASSTIVHYVSSVRDKTTGPALVASRYLVYFLAVLFILVLILILSIITLTRLLVAATSELSFVDEGEPWFAYLILGGILTLGGLLFWRLKEPKLGN